MATIDTQTQAGKVLLAPQLDVDAALSLRHWAKQYCYERKAVEDAVRQIPEAGFEDGAIRLAVGYWALGDKTAMLENSEKAGKSALSSALSGLVAEEEGEFEEALKHYQTAAALAPTADSCVLRQLSALRQLGRAEEALELAEKLRRDFGDKANLAYFEGRCLEETGRQQEALDKYVEAVSLDEAHYEAIYHAGRLCDLRGLTQEAKSFYKKIDHTGTHTFVNAALNLALIYEDEGRYENAIHCCRAVLNSDPQNRRARLFLAEIMASANMYYSPEETKQSERLEAILRVPVSDFELSVRSRNCLTSMDIMTLGDLVKRTESEMLAFKNFGETSLREIRDILGSKGLRLGMLREDAATRTAMDRARKTQHQEILLKSIGYLDLGVRARKCCENLGLNTIGDLTARTEAELAAAKNFGRVSLNEVKKKLIDNGLNLRDPSL